MTLRVAAEARGAEAAEDVRRTQRRITGKKIKLLDTVMLRRSVYAAQVETDRGGNAILRRPRRRGRMDC